MRPEFYSVRLLFRHAGLGLKLEEEIREQYGGLPPEVGDLFRRALLGEDIETATLGIGEPSCEPSSPSVHVKGQPRVKQSAEGPVQRVPVSEGSIRKSGGTSENLQGLCNDYTADVVRAGFHCREWTQTNPLQTRGYSQADREQST